MRLGEERARSCSFRSHFADEVEDQVNGSRTSSTSMLAQPGAQGELLSIYLLWSAVGSKLGSGEIVFDEWPRARPRADLSRKHVGSGLASEVGEAECGMGRAKTHPC